MLSKKRLAQALCKLEGKRKQVDIAQMSEILKAQTFMMSQYLLEKYYDKLEALEYDDASPMAVIMRDAIKDAKAAKKKNKK